MGYPDYQLPDSSKSYLSRTEILKFLNDYCDNFKLRDKFRVSMTIYSIANFDIVITERCKKVAQLQSRF